jgi:hypothetical protein
MNCKTVISDSLILLAYTVTELVVGRTEPHLKTTLYNYVQKILSKPANKSIYLVGLVYIKMVFWSWSFLGRSILIWSFLVIVNSCQLLVNVQYKMTGH